MSEENFLTGSDLLTLTVDGEDESFLVTRAMREAAKDLLEAALFANPDLKADTPENISKTQALCEGTQRIVALRRGGNYLRACPSAPIPA